MAKNNINHKVIELYKKDIPFFGNVFNIIAESICLAPIEHVLCRLAATNTGIAEVLLLERNTT